MHLLLSLFVNWDILLLGYQIVTIICSKRYKPAFILKPDWTFVAFFVILNISENKLHLSIPQIMNAATKVL